MRPYLLKRVIGGILTMGLPVAFMEFEHIKWEPTVPEKIRIAMKHTGFWGGLGLAFYIMHSHQFISRFIATQSAWWKPMPVYIGLASLPILGYLGMTQLGKWLLKSPQASLIPSESIASKSLEAINRSPMTTQPGQMMPFTAPQPKPIMRPYPVPYGAYFYRPYQAYRAF